MGNDLSGVHESFEGGLLEHPHYTRPQVFEGEEIPAVLTSGHHGDIAKWREAEARRLTAQRRPDLLAQIASGCPFPGHNGRCLRIWIFARNKLYVTS